MNATERVPRVYLTLRCQMACWYCSNGRDLAQYDEIGGDAWLKRLEAFPANDVIFTGGEPTLHRDFESIVRGCVKAKRCPHVYTNLERAIPDSMDDLASSMRWRLSCHSQDEASAMEWVRRATDARARGFRLAVTTVHCPDGVMGVLRGHSIIVDTGQQRPPYILPPVRCIINRVFLAPDGTRYHCVGKLVKKDGAGVVPDADGNSVICHSPERCAPCDSLASTRVAVE